MAKGTPLGARNIAMVALRGRQTMPATLWQSIRRDRMLLLMVLPVVIHYLIFIYYPMYGNIIAFKNYSPVLGIHGSEWVGFRYFTQFFNSPYFGRVVRNTLLISLYSILWGFPIPILFALMTNDLRTKWFKRFVQAVSYIPYFLSTVVICGMLFKFLSPSSGIVNTIIKALGGKAIHFLLMPEWFRTVFIASGIWQGFGWQSIIYLAALTSINPELYEAAHVDGAGKLRQAFHVSIPCIMPTIIVTFILQIGALMSVGYEKVILLYNPNTMGVGDVISSYVYRTGLVESNYSFGAAVGIFNSVINFTLVIVANQLSKRFTETSLW